MPITLCAQKDDARRHLLAAKSDGKKVGIVPTMGALHQGHLSLVKAASSTCNYTAVTIFVNPSQFGPGEDLEKYPRDLNRDLELLDGLGVDLVFAPNPDEIYTPSHSTWIQPPDVALPLEGERRPGHFRGVATIVLKLFQILPADVAFFGQKDFQQTRVIQDMVADLDLPISVQVCVTVREPDGLALSSRNAYLSNAERQRSVAIPQALTLAVQLFRDGQTDAAVVQDAMVKHLQAAGIDSIDYVALVDEEKLQPVARLTKGNMILIAAYSGSTRLIDNVQLN